MPISVKPLYLLTVEMNLFTSG